MTILQAIAIAVLQGVTELFPVSSLGHTVVLPTLLGWGDIQSRPDFLPLIVIMHFGTAVALLIYFRRDWLDFARSLAGRDPERTAADRRLLLMIAVATIPAALIGFFFESKLRTAFASPLIAASFLVLNGIILLAGEEIRHRGRQTLEQLGIDGALAIGIAQATALLPGLSRSGMSMIGGVVVGLRHADAARFSFLIATPIIFGAALHQIPKLGAAAFSPLALVCFFVSGACAYASTAVLMRYFAHRDLGALNPFAFYCAIFGFVSLWVLVLRG
jgi:undecaprenyl-diphosphatase